MTACACSASTLTQWIVDAYCKFFLDLVKHKTSDARRYLTDARWGCPEKIWF